MDQEYYYFAHPYSCLRHYDIPGLNAPMQITAGIEANFRVCCYRSAELVLRGYIIFSPISHSHPIQMAHAELAKMNGTEEGKLWYAFDNVIIDRSNFDGIILAPGWEDSTGCVAEKERFEKQGKKVLYYKDIVNGC